MHLRRPAVCLRGRVKVPACGQDHGRRVVVIGCIGVAMIGRMPVVAMVCMPSGMIVFHPDLSGAVGERREDWHYGKRKKQHECRQPCNDALPLAHPPLRHGASAPRLCYPPGGVIIAL